MLCIGVLFSYPFLHSKAMTRYFSSKEYVTINRVILFNLKGVV
jgi:hypothetical protein